MKATGIVRRIDELGRIVIPKEIRRTQRIRQGDSLEIFTAADGEVVFKKYSPLAELGEPAAVYADVLARRLRCAVAVCDREHIVAAAGAGKGELLGTLLPPEIEPLLTRRKLYTAPASAAGEAGANEQARPQQLVKVRVTRTGTNISGMTYLAGVVVNVTPDQAAALEQAKAGCRVF